MAERMLWDIWQESWAKKSCVVHLFLWLVTHANTGDEECQGLTIGRGQLPTSIRGLSKQTGISGQSVRTALKQLCLTRHITQHTTHSNTIITICNYDSYVIRDFKTNASYNKISGTPKSEENETTNDIVSSGAGKPQSFPSKTRRNSTSSAFCKPTLEECTAYASDKSYRWDVGMFFDYYEACGWKVGNKPMKDWKAAMRNWNRRENEKSNSIARQDENNRYGITFGGNTCEQKSKESLYKIIRRLDQE